MVGDFPSELSQPAEQFRDYLFFRFVAAWGARLTVAGLIFSGWHLVWYRDPLGETFVFLLSTTALALVGSLIGGLVAYFLFKRRGGHVEKTPAPIQPR